MKHWLLSATAVLVIAYASLTTSIYWFVRYHRNHAAVRYTDLAFPWRWSGYHMKQGEYMLQDGLHLAAAGKLELAIAQTRKGLARLPQSREGRLLLAQLYINGGRPDLARQSLLDGLPYHSGDPAYVGPVLQFLLAQEEDTRVVSISEPMLTDSDLSPDLIRLVALSAARACFYRGHYDRAEHFLQTPGVASSPGARLLGARIEWERGYQDLALMQLRDLNRARPQDEGIYAQLDDYLRAAGYRDEARRLALLHQLAYPDRPRSAIDQLHVLADEGDSAKLDQAAERALRDLAENREGLLALGDFAASHGMVSVARGVQNRFQALGSSDTITPRLMVAEALLGAKRYPEALQHVQKLSAEPGLADRYVNVCLGLEAIAHYGLGDPVAGYTSLTTLLSRPNLRAASLVAIARRLATMDYSTPAREVLNQAVNLDPRNQAALTQLIELEMDIGHIATLSRQLRALTQMRKPSPAILRRAQRLLRSDSYLFLPQRDELLELLSTAIEPVAGPATN